MSFRQRGKDVNTTHLARSQLVGSIWSALGPGGWLDQVNTADPPPLSPRSRPAHNRAEVRTQCKKPAAFSKHNGLSCWCGQQQKTSFLLSFLLLKQFFPCSPPPHPPNPLCKTSGSSLCSREETQCSCLSKLTVTAKHLYAYYLWIYDTSHTSLELTFSSHLKTTRLRVRARGQLRETVHLFTDWYDDMTYNAF